MTNQIEPLRRPVLPRLLPRAAALPARALARRLSAVAAWARLTNGVLRLDEADAIAPLDPQSRALLWQVLTETTSRIGVLTAADLPPLTGLAALAALADRLRDCVSIGAPQPASPIDGGEPPQIFMLEILIHDLQPCLGRWQPRLAAWNDAGRRACDWPLLGLCRADLARTRERLIERGWQLGLALGLSGLRRVLPERPASVPTLIALDELTGAEAAANPPPDSPSIAAGWHIYVEAAARLPMQDLPSAPGALGEAIASLDTLSDEIRQALKAAPPASPNCAAETIQALALGLLTEGIQPFLAEWRPRYQRFLATDRGEAKWRRADECRAALIATRQRCLPTIEAIGHKIGAPPLPRSVASVAAAGDEPWLQLPPPFGS